MSDLSALVSEDSRTPAERLRRFELWRVADKAGVTYPADAPKTVMLELIKAHQIDVRKYHNFFPVNGTTPEGVPHTELYPEHDQHFSADKDIDYDAAIEERTRKEEKVEKDNDQIKKLQVENEALREVIGNRLDKLEENNFPLAKLLPWQLVHMARDRGIDYKGMTTEELRSALEG